MRSLLPPFLPLIRHAPLSILLPPLSTSPTGTVDFAEFLTVMDYPNAVLPWPENGALQVGDTAVVKRAGGAVGSFVAGDTLIVTVVTDGEIKVDGEDGDPVTLSASVMTHENIALVSTRKVDAEEAAARDAQQADAATVSMLENTEIIQMWVPARDARAISMDLAEGTVVAWDWSIKNKNVEFTAQFSPAATTSPGEPGLSSPPAASAADGAGAAEAATTEPEPMVHPTKKISCHRGAFECPAGGGKLTMEFSSTLNKKRTAGCLRTPCRPPPLKPKTDLITAVPSLSSTAFLRRQILVGERQIGDIQNCNPRQRWRCGIY